MTAQSKPTLKTYFETGDYPTEAQFGDLIDSLQLPYQNVVVVDPAGNGDYTTLSAALAAITDATASNRYAILLFGTTAETGNFNWKANVDLIGLGGKVNAAAGRIITFSAVESVKISGVHFGSNITLSFSGSTANAVSMSHCVVDGSISVQATITLRIFASQLANITSSATASASTIVEVYESLLISTTQTSNLYPAATFRFTGCRISRTTGQIVIQNTANLILDSTVVDFTSGYLYLQQGGNLQSSGGRIRGSSGNALAIDMTPGTVRCVATHFVGGGDVAVYADSAYADAPFYHCAFEGGVTNITCAAGTANGSSVSF